MKISIKAKIIGLLSCLLLMMTFTALYTIGKTSDISEDVQQIAGLNSEMVKQLTLINNHMLEQAIVMERFFRLEDQPSQYHYRRINQQLSREFYQLNMLLDQARLHTSNIKDISFIKDYQAQIQSVHQTSESLQQQVLLLFDQIKAPEQPLDNRQLSQKKADIEQLVQNLDQTIGTLLLSVENDSQHKLLSIQRNEQALIRAITIIFVLTILLTLVIGLILVLSIDRSLNTLKRTCEKVIEGDLNSDFKSVYEDEIGELAMLLRQMIDNIKTMTDTTTAFADGDYQQRVVPRSNKDQLGHALLNLMGQVSQRNQIIESSNWQQTQLGKLVVLVQSKSTLSVIATDLLSTLASMINASYGAFYLNQSEQDDSELELLASYAYEERKQLNNRIKPGQGLVGQCALEGKRIVVSDLPEDYVKVNSGLGSTAKINVVVVPLLAKGECLAVIELATVNPFEATHLGLLDQVSEVLGTIINNIQGRQRIEQLLHISQQQSEELQTQSEELQTQSEELRTTNEELEEKSNALTTQSVELEKVNEQLTQKADSLLLQKSTIEQKNLEVEEKARALQVASKYKSEFLANMSHELRTPLNSLLMLAQVLCQNNDNNLNEEQLASVNIIYQGGQELLALINDILDLSKVEAGKLTVQSEKVILTELTTQLRGQFAHEAEKKQLDFSLVLADNLPEFITTDGQRLRQILKNLLSNALKFTHNGTIKVDCYLPSSDQINALQNPAQSNIAFEVADTGIGIDQDKQAQVFEAFQQVDGSISRKYGGTGLGLTICRELARLLGGELTLRSELGQGTVFTLYLPTKYVKPAVKPSLPGVEKIIQAAETVPQPRLDAGQSAEDKIKQVMVIDSDLNSQKAIAKLLQNPAIKTIPCTSNQEAQHQLAISAVDLVIIDPPSVDVECPSFRDKLDSAQIHGPVPIIVYTAQPPDALAQELYAEFADTIVIKGNNAQSRLLDEIKLFLYNTKASQKPVADRSNQIEQNGSLSGKTVLIVDDDQRNVFAIRKVLENQAMKTCHAANGKIALDLLAEQPEISLVLMDIMMPVLDGYQTMRRIRQQPALAELPIIALTAKAMLGDKRKCLEAGANDYLTKPVDVNQLISMLKIWLFGNQQ